MNLTTRGKIFLLICFFSFIFSCLIITLNYIPHLGLSFSLLIFTLFSYRFKKNKNKDTQIFLAFTVLFSALLIIRSEPFVTFLNLSASLFFGTLMLTSPKSGDSGFLNHIFSPMVLVVKSVLTKSEYAFEYAKGDKSADNSKTANTILGILISIILVLVVIPLLSSANPYFQRIVEDVLAFFDLEKILENIGFDTIFIWSVRLVFFFVFLFIIPKIITLINKTTDLAFPLSLKLDTFSLTIPKSALSIILFVFLFTQIQFYFADQATLKNLGLSYSQHTREVFAQLSIVAGIIMLLLYNDRKNSGINKTLNWILGIQGIFLTAMAYKSVFEYINTWGLTYKRLYGLTFASWISGIFLLFFYNQGLKKGIVPFVKNTIIISGLILLLINIFNFDYLIYHFKKAATGQGIDYTYLSTLSPDSLSYKDQYSKLEDALESGKYPNENYNNKNPYILLYKIDSLQNKYSRFDLRTFNLLDFLQYQQIKSIDTNFLRTTFNKSGYTK